MDTVLTEFFFAVTVLTELASSCARNESLSWLWRHLNFGELRHARLVVLQRGELAARGVMWTTRIKHPIKFFSKLIFCASHALTNVRRGKSVAIKQIRHAFCLYIPLSQMVETFSCFFFVRRKVFLLDFDLKVGAKTLYSKKW
jgi:hypothetical protein